MDSRHPLDSGRNIQPGSGRINQMSLEDKFRRDTFKMAYFTEVGEISRSIDISEFHDLVVCAGVDIDETSVKEAWPKDKEEITMDEAYHLFTRLPNLEFKVKHTLETIEQEEKNIPYDYLIEYIKKKHENQNPEKEMKLIQMLQTWKEEKVTPQQALAKFIETKAALRDINKSLSDRARQQFTARSSGEPTADRLNENVTVITKDESPKNEKPDLQIPESPQENKRVIPVLDVEMSDSGDYSSVFVDDHIGEIHSGGQYSPDTVSLAQRPLSDRPIEDEPSSEAPVHMFKIIRKSLTMQKKDGINSSIGHTFTLSEVRSIQIEVRINDKIDPDLNRFENALYGVLQRKDGQLIVLTTKKNGKKISTEKCTLFPGSYVFYVNFCRKQPKRTKKPFDLMVDKATGKLSPKYRVCVMNIFDMFDFNDDQVLDHSEFTLYNLLNGSGALPDDQWEALLETFDHRDDGLTMKAFVDMHQFELDSYEDKSDLKDMWLSLEELGFDEHFQLAESCPIFIEYNSTDEEITLDKYDTDYWETTNKKDLVEYYWKNGEQIPYMKDFELRLWTCDYYGILVAGPTSEPTRYHLRLDGSKNVNLDVDKSMIIDKTVFSNTYEILVVGIAVDMSHDWFISVRRATRVSVTSQVTIPPSSRTEP